MSSLSDLARDAIESLGGRAPAQQIAKHVAASLGADEYRVVIRGYLGRMEANRALAQRFAEECEAVHGVHIDISAEGAA